MAESFITVLNGVVTGKHHGDMNADFYGTPYYGHEKVAVPFTAAVVPLEPVTFYTQDWERKSDCCLIMEGLLPMPQGYVREENQLRPMTRDERILAGLDDPPFGHKIEDGVLVPMTLEERVEAGQITQEDYEQTLAMENGNELNRRLAELQTRVSIAKADVDPEYAAERKAKMIALLAVTEQPGWPVTVEWPE